MAAALRLLLRRLPSPHRETWQARVFAATRVPMLAMLWPRVVRIDARGVALRVPLNWRTRNHVRSQYLGAMVAAADLAAGLNAMRAIERAAAPVVLVFKDVHADFVKRATSHTTYTCDDGERVAAAVDECVRSGERVNVASDVVATSDVSGDVVARFTLTLSMKVSDKGML